MSSEPSPEWLRQQELLDHRKGGLTPSCRAHSDGCPDAARHSCHLPRGHDAAPDSGGWHRCPFCQQWWQP